MEGAIYRPFFYAYYSLDWSLHARATENITHNNEGIDEEFQEF